MIFVNESLFIIDYQFCVKYDLKIGQNVYSPFELNSNNSLEL